MGRRPLDRPQIQPLDIVDGKVGGDGLRIDTMQSPETRYGPDLSHAKDTGQVSLRLSRTVWGEWDAQRDRRRVARDERAQCAPARRDRDRPPRCAAVTGGAEARYQEMR